MVVKRRHPFTGKITSLDLDITETEWNNYHKGELVHVCFPRLSLDEREFIISGIPPGEWGKFIPEQ